MKDEYVDYTLPDTIKNWKTKWFYMDNCNPPLEAATGFSPVYNFRWREGTSESKKKRV
jgi:hypothetical protein